MEKFLVFGIVVGIFSVAACLKEWKNFENGKVYSHKTPALTKDTKSYGARRNPMPEEKILHSHHRDKKAMAEGLQTAEEKPFKRKNAERHHRKAVEEEMHLKPLNERHHKFPNPALLDKVGGSTPQPTLSSKKIVKQTKMRRQNNKRRQRGRNQKRNRNDNRDLQQLDNNSDVDLSSRKATEKPESQTQKPVPKIQEENNPSESDNAFPLKLSSYW